MNPQHKLLTGPGQGSMNQRLCSPNNLIIPTGSKFHHTTQYLYANVESMYIRFQSSNICSKTPNERSTILNRGCKIANKKKFGKNDTCCRSKKTHRKTNKAIKTSQTTHKGPFFLLRSVCLKFYCGIFHNILHDIVSSLHVCLAQLMNIWQITNSGQTV